MTSKPDNLQGLIITDNDSIRDCASLIDRNGKRIALVVDGGRHLVSTITDGDIRRAILNNIGLDEPVARLLKQKAGTPYAQPVTARLDDSRATHLKLLQDNNIAHLPLLDEDQRVVDLVTLDQLVAKGNLPLQAVIMAGGYGTRLRPLTEDTPKAMLPVGDTPLMEIIVGQLQQAGIYRVHLTVHHQSEKMIDHFGDGQEFGVHMTYVAEDRPLGTVGALGLMDQPEDTMLVINGDILTQVDFQAMLAFHQEHKAELTVAVQQYQLNVPYGVIEVDGPAVRGLVEKPVMNYFINAGIYLLEPSVHGSIPTGERYDMTELIQYLIDEGRSVAAFPIHEKWLDIGQHADYEKAQEMIKDWPERS